MDSLSLNKEIKIESQPINRLSEAEKEDQIQQSVFAEEEGRLTSTRTETMSKAMPYEAASKQIDQLLKIFDGILKKSSDSLFVSSREMSQRLLRIAETYRPEIDRVSRRTALSDPRIIRINAIIDQCKESLQKESVDDEQVEKMTSQIMDNNEDEVAEGLSSSVDSTLSAETMQGVLSIDRWMLRNMHGTGIRSIWGENDKFAFVSRLLALSARERLYMYYIIEKGDRHNVQNSDVIESQLNYVPDKKAFADKMKMSAFRIFRRAAMGRIYWDKLSDAYGQLESVRPAILKYSTIDQTQNVNSRLKRDTISRRYIRKEVQNGTYSIDRITTFEATLKERDAKADLRDKRLVAFKDAMVDFKNKKEIAEKAWVGKKKKKAASDAAADEAQKRLRELLDSDDAVGQLEKTIRATGHRDLDGTAKDTDGKEMIEDGFSKGEVITDISDRVISNAGYGFSAVADPIMDAASEALDLEDGSRFLDLSEAGLSNLSSVSLAALSVLSVASVASAFIAFCDLVSEGGSMMGGDLVSAASDLVSQVLTASESLFTTFTASVSKINEVSELLEETVLESIEGLEDVASVVGVTTASVALAANSISMVNSIANSLYLQDAETELKINRAIGKNRDARKERYEDNLIKHQKRVLAEEKKSTAIDLVSNAALFTSAVSGGTLSAVAGGISIGLCIYSTIRDSIMSRKMTRQTVDDYLGISGENNELLEQAFSNYLSRTQSAKSKYAALDGKKKSQYKKDTINKLRDNIRNEVMAKMGCATKTALFGVIMEKYGEIVFNGAFKNGDDVITDPADLKELSHRPYVDFISSLGLKIKFKDGKLEAPTQKAIVTKLQG